MPVILELISDPGPDDLNDLTRLYQDYPPTLADSAHTLNDWITGKLAAGQLLFAGRFNGRLVGAVWGVDCAHGWQLDYLCVRAATRRRGVAQQLLTLLAKHAYNEHRDLQVDDNPLPAAARALLAHTGFHCSDMPREGKVWTLKANRP